VEHIKLAGASHATEPAPALARGRPPPSVAKSAPVLLSAPEIGALRTIAAELVVLPRPFWRPAAATAPRPDASGAG